jgi:predicted secreted protein with PEFG-CTERM motif
MRLHLPVISLLAIIIVSVGLAPAFGQITNPITVTTDKTDYKDGETVMVTGEVREILTGYPVSLTLLAPNGNLVTVEQIEIGPGNQYSTELTLGGPLMRSGGVYTIEVLYGTQTRVAQTTFTFPGSSDSGKTIQVSGTEFMVNYKITGGTIKSIMPDKTSKSLIIEIDSFADGALTITLPRGLIDSLKGDGTDDEFFVLVDGEEREFGETKTAMDRTLTIEFEAGAEMIEIIGTFVIPEFCAIAAMILAVAIISIIVVSAKSRLSIIPRY